MPGHYLSEMRLGMLMIFDGTPPMVILRAGGFDILLLLLEVHVYVMINSAPHHYQGALNTPT